IRILTEDFELHSNPLNPFNPWPKSSNKMTRYVSSIIEFSQERLFDFAAVYRDGAAVMEPASAGRIKRRRYVASQNDPALPGSRVRDWNGPQQCLGIRMLRREANLTRCADLYQLSQIHDADPRRDVFDDRNGVRDK